MKKVSYLALVLLFSFSAPILVSAQVCPPGQHTSYALNTPSCVADSGISGSTGATAAAPFINNIIGIINNLLVPLLFALSFIVFLYGVAKTYIFSRGESAEITEGHNLILWGIIGFVVMISVWGLVNIVSATFSLGNTGAIANWPKSR